MAAQNLVGFPVLSNSVPAIDDEKAFADSIVLDGPPHWIFNLRVACRKRAHHSLFRPITAEQIAKLARQLGLNRFFDLLPMEFNTADLLGKSPYRFPSLPIDASSATLAVAVGLVAAETNRPLPKWLLMSGCVDTSTSRLPLELTKGIESKTLLASNCRDDYYCTSLLDRLFEHPKTIGVLGRRESRIEPGRIKLFLTSAEVDREPNSFDDHLNLKPLQEISLATFGQKSFSKLEAIIDGMRTNNGLLLIQVPTVWHALYLLGFHHNHELVSTRLGKALSDPLMTWEISCRDGGTAFSTGIDSTPAQIEQERVRIDHLLKEARAQGPPQRLRVILKRAQKLLRCQTGDIETFSPAADRLDVVVRHCPGFDDLPYTIRPESADLRRLHNQELPHVVENVRDDEDYKRVVKSCDEAGVYQDRHRGSYREFLGRFKAYVRFPLRHQGRTLGVMYLNREKTGEFSKRMVRIVQEALAARAGEELARQLDEYLRDGPLPSATGEHLLQSLDSNASQPRTDAMFAMGDDLAETACHLTGAYRAAVRIQSRDGKRLLRIGFFGAGDETAQAPELDLEADSAAGYAFVKGETYVIPDVGRDSRKKLLPLAPTPGSHIAIPLQVAGDKFGVLNVDFTNPDECTPAHRSLLEKLARRYAIFLRGYNSNDMLRKIFHATGIRTFDGTDIGGCLRFLAKNIIGAVEAAFLLRSNKTGRYELAYSILDAKKINQPDAAYEPGRGLTGWVLQHGRVVRIKNLQDKAEIQALGNNHVSSPVCSKPWTDELVEAFGRSYLGVPLVYRAKILGMFRFTTAKPGGFNHIDEHFAVVAAARVAQWLGEQEDEARQTKALEEHARSQSRYDKLDALLDHYRRILIQGLGDDCLCLFRLAQKSEGTAVLHRLGTEPEWVKTPVDVAVKAGIAGKVADDDRLLAYDDVSQLDSNARSELPLASGCGVCVPMRAGELVGTLQVHRINPNTMTRGDCAFVADVAALAAPALRGATQQPVDRLLDFLGMAMAWFEVQIGPNQTEAAIRSAEIDLVGQFGQLVASYLGSDTGCLWMAEADDDDLDCQVAWGVDQATTLPLPLGAATEAFAHGDTVCAMACGRQECLQFLVSHLPEPQRQSVLVQPGYAFRVGLGPSTYLVLLLACEEGRAPVEERARRIQDVLYKFCPVITMPRSMAHRSNATNDR